MYKYITSIVVVFIMLFSSVLPAAAIDYIDHDYTIDPISGSDMPIPIMYKVDTIFEKMNEKTIQTNLLTLNKPQDLFLGNDDSIYIADTGNNRVLKFNKDFKLLLEIKNADGKSFNQPSGLYVDRFNDIYIADTLNSRIVHMDFNGKYIESFIKPKTDLLPDNTDFNPSKVVINENQGLIYILFGKQFITIDADNNFKGFVGSERVGFSIRDFFVALVGTKEQKNKLVKREPPSFSNIFMSQDSSFYATSLGNSNQIKKLNLLGENYFNSGYYGEQIYLSAKEEPLNAKLIDISVNKNGFITTADANSCKIYLYDSNGNMLGVYGGKGNTKGKFTSINSLVTGEDGKVYILDGSTNSLTVFTPTYFTVKVEEAINSFNNGQYNSSYKEWQNISKISSNYPLYEKSIGEIYMKQKEYKKAMDLYKISGDKAGYLNTFSLYRYTVYEKNFGFIFVFSIILIVLVVWLLLKANKSANIYEEQMWSERRR